MNDLKFASRQLMKNPGFTAVAVLTLALGIGANTGIFSVANAVLLRPLPYRDSGQLVWVYRQNVALGYNRIVVTPGRFCNLKERNTCFSQMASLRPNDFTLVSDEKPQLLRGLSVSPNLTEVLGVTPVLGRGFRPEEGEDGSHRVALLSYGVWQSRFGGNPNMIGKSIRSDTDTFTVVGVLPQNLSFPLGTLAGAGDDAEARGRNLDAGRLDGRPEGGQERRRRGPCPGPFETGHNGSTGGRRGSHHQPAIGRRPDES